MEEILTRLRPLLKKYEQLYNQLRFPAIRMSGRNIELQAPDRMQLVPVPFPGWEKLIDDYKSLQPGEGDKIFEDYAVGNSLQIQHSPFERMQAYEILLLILREIDEPKFYQIHKGTPYYFMSWVCYQLTDFQKAFFYMDAAASEDLRIPDVASRASTRPSLDFFLLKDQSPGSGLAVHHELKAVLEKTIDEFNRQSSLSITKDDFVQKFVTQLLYGGKEKRSLLTTLYVFLLEYEKREVEIQLRSSDGGSIELFLDHLFDGARLLESLLQEAGGTGNVLKSKIISLPAIGINTAHLYPNQSLQDAELKFNQLKAAGESFENCNFAASYIIRNTTGHSLLWPDQFQTVNSYFLLYNCLVNSIFWAISKLW